MAPNRSATNGSIKAGTFQEPSPPRSPSRAPTANHLGEYKLRVTGLAGEVESAPVQAGLFSILPDRSLLLQGTPGTRYRIETAEQINTAWIEMTTVVLSDGSATVPAGNDRARYFRAVLLSP